MGRVTRINVDVPDALHRRVKSAAALAGLNLRDYVTAALDAYLASGRPHGKTKP